MNKWQVMRTGYSVSNVHIWVVMLVQNHLPVPGLLRASVWLPSDSVHG